MKPPEECGSLQEIRTAIDALDREIVTLVGRRGGYVDAAARFKRDRQDVRAPERQRSMLDERRRWAVEEGLDPEVVANLFRNLVEYFVARETERWREPPPF